MTTFNTGNPIGSTDSRDRLDNAENADILENSTSLRYHADRLGTVRKTRYGMQKEHDDQMAAHENEFNSQLLSQNSEHDDQMAAHENEFDAKIATYDNEFDAHISGMAISNVGTFTSGYTLTNIRQSLTYSVDGYEYSWSGAFPKVVPAGATPATSGGIGINAWVVASIGASIATPAQTNSRLSSNQVVSPAGLNAVVPYAPTVNPTLDLDFAKQKYRWYAGAAGLTESSTPSLMTFTRSSIATYFDAIGVMKSAAVDTPRIDYNPLTGECKGLLIEEARTNLLTYSSNLEMKQLTWCRVLPFATKSPDGYLIGAKLIADTTNAQHRAEQSSTVVIGTQYTASVFAKAGELSQIQLRTANDLVSFVFDLSSGTATNQGAVGTGGITSVGNGWYLCWCCYAPTSTTTYTRVNLLQGGSNTFTGDNMSGVYLFGLQLEAGTFPTSYIPTPAVFSGRASTATYLDANGVVQTAASGVARSAAYDYDSDGVLRPIGLLLEGAATNLLLYSEQFDNAVWLKAGVTVTANATTSPDGNVTADKVTEDSSNTTRYVTQSSAVSPSTTYTGSCYIKGAGRNYARITINDGATSANVFYDLVNGAIFSKTANVVSCDIKKAANGFWRCIITITTGASSSAAGMYVYPCDSTPSASYTGDGTSGIYVWGAQLAAGNYATSYIATTSAQVTRVADTSTSAQATRAADNAVISGANFSQWYNQNEGAIQCSVDINALGGPLWPGVFSLLSNASNRIGSFVSDASDDYVSVSVRKDGASLSFGTQLTPVVANQVKKIAASFGNSVALSSYASGAVMTYTPSGIGIPIGISALHLGFFDYKLNGHIRSLKYFPKALAATELQAMTA